MLAFVHPLFGASIDQFVKDVKRFLPKKQIPLGYIPTPVDGSIMWIFTVLSVVDDVA
jgi:hypothetical protein